MIKITGLVLSAILHLIIFAYVLLEQPAPTKPVSEINDIPVPGIIILKIIDMTPAPISTVEVPADTSRIKYQTDLVICSGKDKTYLGIGFVYQPGSNMVTRVPPGLPAYDAGVRVGDYVLDPDAPIVDGHITIHIRRAFEFITFRIRAANICFQDS